MITKGHNEKLSVDELAEALYEGMPHLQNLAEKLARQHGKALALTFYGMQGEGVKNFWRDIARRLIAHSSQWQVNDGSCCVLSKAEHERLQSLPGANIDGHIAVLRLEIEKRDVVINSLNEALRRRNTALRFYGEIGNWKPKTDNNGMSDCDIEKGAKARAALAEKEDTDGD